MKSSDSICNNHGVTLIELIVTIVVISIALTGVLLVTSYTTRHSADPVLRHQAVAIAEAYMEEITLKNYLDPDTSTLCPAAEPSRSLYDNICDYDNLADSGAADQNGNVISGLANYSVRVAVSNPEQAYGPAGMSVNGLRIEVTVTDPAGESMTLTGYRANY